MPRGSKKGEYRGGRKKGTPNRSTAELREMLTMVVNKEFDNLEETLSKIEKENGPKARFDSFMKIVDFSLPKLKGIEFKGADDQSIKIEIKKTK